MKEKDQWRNPDEGREDEEEAVVVAAALSSKVKKGRKRNSTETLLDYIEKGKKKKKEVSFDLLTGTKKKRHNRKRANGVNSKEAILVEEKLVCSLMDYRKTFPGQASVQFFLSSAK